LLITGSAFNPMYHSEQRQWPSARALRPDPLVTLHPSTAASLGLQKGDWVLVETPQGAVRLRLRVMDKIHPGMVDAQHGWWFPEGSPEGEIPFDCLSSNINVLVRDDPDRSAQGTGAWQQTGIPCRVRRAEEDLPARGRGLP
jgi:anaerobic selenocysteine-containing dehydrogenase